MNYFILSVLAICSYFFGNISNARIISAILKRDITKEGSGNPGTMNMLRTFGFKVGLLTLCLDTLKGAIPALTGYLIFGASGEMADFALYLAGLFVVLGHNFPLLYKFKGGKGVACILGVYAVASPLWALITFAVCFLYLLMFDYGAVASFIFITCLTIFEALQFQNIPSILIILCILYFLTFLMHRKNIMRLLEGKENKVNLKKSLEKLSKRQKKDVKIIKKDLKESSKDKERQIG